MTPTDDEMAMARLHATAWEHAANDAMKNATMRSNETMHALALLACMIGGGYRRIANGAELDD